MTQNYLRRLIWPQITNKGRLALRIGVQASHKGPFTNG